MNQIPSVGSDAAIAPRTGSGSPQSSPQQRADAVATVVSDSISAEILSETTVATASARCCGDDCGLPEPVRGAIAASDPTEGI